MINEQTVETVSPVDMGSLLHDLESWHTRAIIRMFYPNTAASVSISMPDSISAFHKALPNLTVIPADQHDVLQKKIFMIRDAVAALVAQGISGKVPEYKGFIEFQKNYDELVVVLRRALMVRASPPVDRALPSGLSSLTIPLSSTSRQTESDPMMAFTSAHNALSDDTPLKRYVRGLKDNRNGHKG